jgi:hypothetical protein
LRDPGSGDEIIAITAVLPARGLPREQRLVDFRLLPSIHGLAVVPRADDLSIEVVADGVVLARPGGLRLTGDGTVAAIAPATRIFGALSWQIDRSARFRQREAELIGALAEAVPGERSPARLALARFYLANELGAEAKGVLDAAEVTGEAPRELFALRGLALLLLGRSGEAADELAQPALAASREAMLIRSAALAGAGRFAEAREAYRAAADALAALPPLLQRTVRIAALRAAIQLDEIGDANALLHALESREPPGGVEPHLAVLAARVAGRLDRAADADKLLLIAERSTDEAAAAEARLWQIEFAMAHGRLARTAAAKRLLALVQSWHGDATGRAARELLDRLQAEDVHSRSGTVSTSRPTREAAATIP